LNNGIIVKITHDCSASDTTDSADSIQDHVHGCIYLSWFVKLGVGVVIIFIFSIANVGLEVVLVRFNILI